MEEDKMIKNLIFDTLYGLVRKQKKIVISRFFEKEWNFWNVIWTS